MSLIATDGENYSNIANAIRSKNGKSNQYYPREMAQAILDIKTGSQDDIPNIKDIFNHGSVVGLNEYYRITSGVGTGYPTLLTMTDSGSIGYVGKLLSLPFYAKLYSSLNMECEVPSASSSAQIYVGAKKVNSLYNASNEMNGTARNMEINYKLSPPFPKSVVTIPLSDIEPGFYCVGLYAYNATLRVYSIWLE